MSVPFSFQSCITLPTISKNNTAGFDRLHYERMEAFCRGIWDSKHTNPSDPVSIFLRSNHNQIFFKSLSASNIFFKATPISFVNLNSSIQSIPSRSDHSSSNFVKPSPGRFITTKSEDPFKAESTCSILLGNNPPYGSEPNNQRFSSALKDGSRNYRCLVSTNGTLVQRFSNWPGFGPAATRTTKSIRPAQPKKIFTAGLFSGKACLNFGQGAGIVFHTPTYYM